MNPTISKCCHYSYMVITLYNLKILLSLLLLSHPISKFYKPAYWIIWELVIPLKLFGDSCVSIIITIISNTTMLVSYNVICCAYFMPMSHGVNKKALPIAYPTPPLSQVFTRFVCCFTRNTYFINLYLLWSDYCKK